MTLHNGDYVTCDNITVMNDCVTWHYIKVIMLDAITYLTVKSQNGYVTWNYNGDYGTCDYITVII